MAFNEVVFAYQPCPANSSKKITSALPIRVFTSRLNSLIVSTAESAPSTSGVSFGAPDLNSIIVSLPTSASLKFAAVERVPAVPLPPEQRAMLQSHRPHQVEHLPLGITAKNGLCRDDRHGITRPRRTCLDQDVEPLRVRRPHADHSGSSAEPPEQCANPVDQIAWRGAVKVQLQGVHFCPHNWCCL